MTTPSSVSTSEPEKLFNKWHLASGFVAPFTPTGGNNDGVVRDARGRAVADCFGCEACADTVAASLNMAFTPASPTEPQEAAPPEDHAEFEELRELSRPVYANFASQHGISAPPSEQALGELLDRFFDAVGDAPHGSDEAADARSEIEQYVASLESRLSTQDQDSKA